MKTFAIIVKFMYEDFSTYSLCEDLNLNILCSDNNLEYCRTLYMSTQYISIVRSNNML
jgi:hypothetical protein